ncbi:MAG: histidine kinase, partial [Chloroflexi bacterium]
MAPQTLLVATLGGQPQVVTFALDALLAQSEPIQAVFVIYPAFGGPRLQRSLDRLQQAFAHQCYAGRPCPLHCIPLQQGATPLSAIRNAAEAEATWQAVHHLLAALKKEGHKLHLCIAGGRRLIGLLVTSAAMLLCDHQDRLWHLYTPDELRARAHEGAIMHVQPDDSVQLIPVPLVPWGAYFPALRAMAQPPAQAVAEQMGAFSASNERQCRQVYDRLSERQRDTLIAFARGLTPQDVAEALHVSLSTVNTHKTAILAECRIAWGLAEEARLDYRFLREHFA